MKVMAFVSRMLFVLKRDVLSEWRVSVNLREGVILKLKRLFWVMCYLCVGVMCGLRAIRREQLGSQVVYDGRECVIINWAGSEAPTLSGHEFFQEYVPRAEIRNRFNLREILHRFQFGFEFFTSCHMGSAVNRRLYPWIRC